MDSEIEEVISILNTANSTNKTASLASKPIKVQPSFKMKIRARSNHSKRPRKTQPNLFETHHNSTLNLNKRTKVQCSPTEDFKLSHQNTDLDELPIKYSSFKLPHILSSTRSHPSPIKTRYLIFKPFTLPMHTELSTLSDTGYYYKLTNGVKLIKQTLEDNGFRENPVKNSWALIWSGGGIKNSVYSSLTKYQKINHFPRSSELTRKDKMYRNIERMKQTYGSRQVNFIPKTFILPEDAKALEYCMSHSSKKWIVKPCASSQGKGIYLATKYSEIVKKACVVCEYIDNPLLINGLKFDLRIYVAITSLHPLRVYMYNEGLVRFATEKYGDGKNRFMHLTNYAVNKYSENFEQNTDASLDNKGSKWSLTALRSLFVQRGLDDKLLFEKIKDLIVKSLISVENCMVKALETTVPFRSNCFELLGYDILIDNTFNPWLLEVNLSPSLNCDSPLDQKIKGELISDLFTMVGIVPIDQRNTLLENRTIITQPYLEKLSFNKTSKKKPKSLKTEKSSKEDSKILKESIEEHKRRGNFTRLFPSELSYQYKHFFEEERPLNELLWNSRWQ